MTPRKDQFSGCLIGQCLGDAVGFVVEGYSPAASWRYVEDYLMKGDVGAFGRFPFPFGQYSDDSQLARELMQSYVACGKFDPADYARRILGIFAEKRIVAFGYSTKEAVKRLAQGVPWEESGTPPPSAGNGSSMRAAPIGLFFFDDPEMLIRAADDQGRITHKDPRSSAGAIAISGAVALALREKTIDAASFLTTLSRWAERISPVFAAELGKLAGWLHLPPEEAVVFISQAGFDPEYVDDDEWKGISGFVISSVLWSLYAFLRTPGDYWQTICTAIGAGGDTDTTAAMAGAISGAHLGIDAIPVDPAHRLTDRGTWKYDDLINLAHECYEIKVQ
ncbi:MAG: ADP-ribosylglycohydrolase family protein, partial [Nitrospirota bacterium]